MTSKHSKKDKARKKRLTQRKDRMHQLYKLLGGYTCKLCEKEYPPCALEFHHTNPKEKSFSISRNILNKRWDVLVEEVKKCVILCSNCHKVAHRVRTHLFTD